MKKPISLREAIVASDARQDAREEASKRVRREEIRGLLDISSSPSEDQAEILEVMELHDCVTSGKGLSILRVPNGWLYLFKEREGGPIVTSTFVPGRLAE
jgi:hypothetical protein